MKENSEIEEINELLQDLSLEENFYAGLRWGSEGYTDFIDLVVDDTVINLWNSEDDGRLFHQKTNEYESFKTFISRKIKKEIYGLQTIFSKLNK